MAWHQPITLGVLASWLLWGLGGLAALTLGTAVALVGTDRVAPRKTGKGPVTRPISDLLPLTHAQASRARWLGRTGALGVSLAVGVAILAGARLVMSVTGAVSALPSLLDPWLVAAAAVWGGITFIAERDLATTRRFEANAAGVRGLLSVVGAMLMVGAGIGAGVLHGPWALALGCGLAFVGIALGGLPQIAPGHRRVTAEAPAPAIAAPRPPRRHQLGQPFAWIGLRAMRAGALSRAEWLRQDVALGVSVFAILTSLGIVFLLLAALMGEIVHYHQTGSFVFPLTDEFPFVFIVAALCVLGAAAPLLGACLANAERMRPTSLVATSGRTGFFPSPDRADFFYSPRHLGLLLPIAPRRLWVGRLLSVLRWVLPSAVALVSAHQVCWRLAQLACGKPLLEVGPIWYLGLVPGLLVAVYFLWLAPLLRPAGRLLAPHGCLLPGLIYLLLIPVVPLMMYLTRHHPEALALMVAALAGLMTLTGLLSYRWCDTQTWPLRPDGARSAVGKARALAVYALMAAAVTVLFLAMIILPIAFTGD